MERLNNCLDCKHFYMSKAHGAWSEITPGDDFGMGCQKSHWDLDTYRDTPAQFRQYMQTALTCKDYDPQPAAIADDEPGTKS